MCFGILLTDPSKPFGCLSHELFVAKSSLYRVDTWAVRFIYNYLTNLKQRTKTVDHTEKLHF